MYMVSVAWNNVGDISDMHTWAEINCESYLTYRIKTVVEIDGVVKRSYTSANVLPVRSRLSNKDVLEFMFDDSDDALLFNLTWG